MPAESTKKATKKPTARSRVTNGSKLGDEIDGRSVWARRLRDLIHLYSSDVNEDLSMIPEATKSLIRRAAVLTVELERAETGFAAEGAADPAALTAYQTTANSLRRLLDSLNIKPEHRTRHTAEAARVIEGARFIRDIVDSFPPQDLALVYGRNEDGTPAVPATTPPTPTRPSLNRDQLRAIAWVIARAKHRGEPIDPVLAKLAVDGGLAEYADLDEEAKANDE